MNWGGVPKDRSDVRCGLVLVLEPPRTKMVGIFSQFSWAFPQFFHTEYLGGEDNNTPLF